MMVSKLKAKGTRTAYCFVMVMLAFSLCLCGRAYGYLDGLTKDTESDLYKAYKWFCAVQNPSGLVSTREGTEGICFVYDQALAIYVYVLFDDMARAKKVMDFFVEKHDDQVMKGKFIGYADMYLATGARGAYHFAVGPNAWLLGAINFYTHKTGDKKYLKLSKALADWMLSLEGIESGLIGGQEEDFYWMSTEHNVDAFSALRDLYNLTGEKKYLKMAKKIKLWLDKCTWNAKEGHFTNGRFDPNFATDVSTWSVASLGTEYVAGLDFVNKVSLTKKFYRFKNVEVEGVDFGSTYERSPYPDKDAVWFEGTGQMAVACYVAGRNDEGDFYTGQLEKALTESPAHPGTLGLPYSSNPGTPAYGGWQMQDEPLCVSSTGWYIYSKLKFNPFMMTGTMDVDKENKEVFDLKVDTRPMFNFTPVVDNFEYQVPKFITAYIDDKIRRKNCVFTRFLEYNKAQEGVHSMRLLFIPKIKKRKKTKKEFDTIVAQEQKEADMSLQVVEEVEGGEKKKKLRRIKFINAEGFTTRPFLVPQDWSKASALSFWINTDNSSNEFFIRVVDDSGNIIESRHVPLEGYGWKRHTMYFNTQDFTLVKRAGRDQKARMDLSKVRKIIIGMKSKPPNMDSIIWVDNIVIE